MDDDGRPIVVLDAYPLDDVQRARLEAASDRLQVIHVPIDDQAALDAFDGADVEVLLGDFAPSDLAAWPRLRWLQYSGAGVDPLAAQAPWAHGLRVTTASGGNAIPIGEYVLGWLLHHSQQIGDLLENRRRRTWATTRMSLGGHGLRGTTLTLIGYGSVGREIARLARPFGVRILAVKARPDERIDTGFRVPGTGDPDGVIPERIVGFGGIPEVVGAADYVVVAAPSTPDTRGVLGAAILAAIRPDAWLINVGRGDIFDELELVAALRAGRLGGAVLDVTAVEPLDPKSALWRLPNAIVTPHVAGLQPATWAALTELFCQNLARYVAGEPLLNPVDPVRGY